MNKTKRIVARLGALVLVLAAAGCQFLQNEFTTLDRSPPSVRADDVDLARPW